MDPTDDGQPQQTQQTQQTQLAPTTTDASTKIANAWKYYKKKLIKPAIETVGMTEKIDSDGNNWPGTYAGDVAAAIPILAAIGIIGGGVAATRRRSKKSKTVKSMSDTFQSGLSTLKSLQSLSFGRKRKSRRKSHKRSHKRSRVRKFGRRSHKRKSHKRKSHKRKYHKR
jgi:hypothetical protein